MIYAVSLYASKDMKREYEGLLEKTTVETVHSACYFAAVSEDEANGKAMRLCKEDYPESEGWKNHSASVVEIKFK